LPIMSPPRLPRSPLAMWPHNALLAEVPPYSQFARRTTALWRPIRGEPLSAGSPAGRDFSAAARNSSQVLAHSRVTLLFFRPRLGEMLQDAAQPQHGGRAGRVLRPGPRLAIGTTRFCAAQHVFRGEGGPRRQAGPAARGQISPQATDIAINSSKETD